MNFYLPVENYFKRKATFTPHCCFDCSRAQSNMDMLRIWIITLFLACYRQNFATSALPRGIVKELWTFFGTKHMFLIEMEEKDSSLFPLENARVMDLTDFYLLW